VSLALKPVKIIILETNLKETNMSHDFHADQDNNGHNVTAYNDDLASLVACLASTFGDEVGQAVNEKVNSVLALEGVDIAAVQAQITTLNNLLSANTSGDAASAQSILAAITAIGARVTTLEGSTAVADLTAVVAGLQTTLATETQNRLDSESSLQANINSVQSNVDQLTQSLVSIQNAIDAGGSNACDCAALTSAIATQATAIANLQASDAATATQIAALQTAIEGLTTAAAGIAAAQATADAASATAQTALANAAAATATANAANAAAAAATAAVAELDSRNEHEHGHFVTKAEVMDINCAAIGAVFRGAMRSRMGLGA
jgi:chromosome segregation ATPase